MSGVVRVISAVAGLLILGLVAAPRPASAEEIVVFAAASLKDAFDQAVEMFQQQGGEKVIVSYAASSALAKQIESGAPADIFVSADLGWMDYLQQRNLIKPDTRKNLLGNRLVLVAPAESEINVEIRPNFPLASLLGDGHLAMADPDAVPAGKYGKAALEELGVWSSVESRVVRAENVRAALFFVSRREAPLGIVYQTDAAADKGVKIVGVFPEQSHLPIVYPIAVTTNSQNADSGKLLRFLESPAIKNIYEKHGFVALP